MIHPLLDTHDPTRYAAVAVRWAGHDGWELASDEENRVLVFDNAQVAADFLPVFGDGRVCRWDSTGERAAFWPIVPDGGVNQAMIVTEYDVYDLPPGHPIPSETRLMPWKGHVIWSEFMRRKEERERARPTPPTPSDP